MTIPNSIFGLFSIIVAIIAVADAGPCSSAQEFRHTWLLIEIIVGLPTFVFYSFPQIFFLCLDKKELEIILCDDNIVEKVKEDLTDEKSTEIARQKKEKEDAKNKEDADKI